MVTGGKALPRGPINSHCHDGQGLGATKTGSDGWLDLLYYHNGGISVASGDPFEASQIIAVQVRWTKFRTKITAPAAFWFTGITAFP